MSEKWLPIKTYDTTPDAFLAKDILENNEIPVIMKDMHVANMYNPVVGGVTLEVEAHNVQRARTLLDGE